jgi:hypothetical protein
MIVSSIFAPKPEDPKDGASNADPGNRQQLPPATDNKLPVVFGTAWASPIITDAKISSDNQTMWYVMPISEVTDGGTITFGDMYWGDKKCNFGTGADVNKVVSFTDGTGVVDTKINDNMWVYFYNDGSSSPTRGTTATAIEVMNQSGIPEAQRWDSTKRYYKTAFIIVKLVYSQDDNVTGLSKVTIQTMNTQTGLTTGYRPGAAMYEYLTNSRYGAGLPASQVNKASFDALDVYADTQITFTTYDNQTSTFNRYRFDGVLDTSRSIMSNLLTMAECCDSFVQFNEGLGQWSIIANRQYLSDSYRNREATDAEKLQLFQFTDSNIIGGISITPLDMNSTPNSLEVSFPNTTIKDQVDFAYSYTGANLRNKNEPDNQIRVSLPFVNNNARAQYVANRKLEQCRADFIIELTADYSAIQVDAGDVVCVTYAPFGGTGLRWDLKEYRVLQVQENTGTDGTVICKFQLSEYTYKVYDDKSIREYTPPPANQVTDPNNLTKPLTPTISNIISTAAAPSFQVNCLTSSTGVTSAMEFWYSTTSNNTNNSYKLYATQYHSSNSNYKTSDPESTTVLGLPQGTYYWRVRAVGFQKKSEFSDPVSINWNPTTVASGTSGTTFEWSPTALFCPSDSTGTVTVIGQKGAVSLKIGTETVPVWTYSAVGTQPNNTWTLSAINISSGITVSAPIYSTASNNIGFTVNSLTTDQATVTMVGCTYKNSSGAITLLPTTSIQVTKVKAGTKGTDGGSGSRGIVALAYVPVTYNPTTATDSSLTTSFCSTTGYSNPIDGDGAYFVNTTSGISSPRKFYGASTPQWSVAVFTVPGESISANSLVGDQIKGNTLTGNKIVGNTITGDKISGATITTDKLAANIITADKIAANAITTDKLAANTITSDKIVAASITSDKLAANVLTAVTIQANSITSNMIQANAITTDKLAANVITSDKIAANSITSVSIVANAITSDKILANSITTDKLQARSVTADKIAAGAITTNSLAANLIISGDIYSNNTVTINSITLGAATTVTVAQGSFPTWSGKTPPKVTIPYNAPSSSWIGQVFYAKVISVTEIGLFLNSALTIPFASQATTQVWTPNPASKPYLQFVLGDNSSPGYWLQANTGNARFGGTVSIGNSLYVDNLIEAGALIANSVTTSMLAIGTAQQSRSNQDDPAIAIAPYYNWGTASPMWPANTRSIIPAGGVTINTTTDGDVTGNTMYTEGPRIEVQISCSIVAEGNANTTYNFVEVWKSKPSSYYGKRVLSVKHSYDVGTYNGSIPISTTNANTANPVVTAVGTGGLDYISYDGGVTWSQYRNDTDNVTMNSHVTLLADSTYTTNGTGLVMGGDYVGPSQKIETHGYIGAVNAGARRQSKDPNFRPIWWNPSQSLWNPVTNSVYPSFSISDAKQPTINDIQVAVNPGGRTLYNKFSSSPSAYHLYYSVGDAGTIFATYRTGMLSPDNYGDESTSVLYNYYGSAKTRKENSNTLQPLRGVYSNALDNLRNYTVVVVGHSCTILVSSKNADFEPSYSTPFIQWTQKRIYVKDANGNDTTTPLLNDLYSVAGDNKINSSSCRWVAVGKGGFIVVSTDNGANWTQVTSPTTQNLNQVRYHRNSATQSAGRWVAVGDNGTIITARDDNITSWSVVASPTTRHLNTIDAVPVWNRWSVGGDSIILTAQEVAYQVPTFTITNLNFGADESFDYQRIWYRGSNILVNDTSATTTTQQILNGESITATIIDHDYKKDTTVTYWLVLGNLKGARIWTGGPFIMVTEYKR